MGLRVWEGDVYCSNGLLLPLSMALKLNQEKALIFRIVHRSNLPWILDNGMHARNGMMVDPNYRNIGNVDLIAKRSRRAVAVPPGGTLSDYVPFYFTPYSMMMLNIRTGYGGVKQVPNDEILIFVSSLHHAAAQCVTFAFTNQHAYPPMAEYFTSVTDLHRIDLVAPAKSRLHARPGRSGEEGAIPSRSVTMEACSPRCFVRRLLLHGYNTAIHPG